MTPTAPVPEAAGTAPPRWPSHAHAPKPACAHACDAHLHVFDPRIVSTGPVPVGATVDDYRRLQARLGTTRAVIVQPRPYGSDHRVTLDAIARLGLANARGVGVLNPGVDDAALQALHAGGIRGIRFTLYTPTNAATRFEMVEPLAHRVAEFGWHLQLHWTADQLVAHEALLARLPCPIVFDHLARLPLPEGMRHPAWAIVARHLDGGRAWVKLSGAYLDSKKGAAGSYADLDPIATAFVARAPERLVWGSDWPHVTEAGHPPDDAALFDLLGHWTGGDESIRRRILVDNPAELYDFPMTTTTPGDSR